MFRTRDVARILAVQPRWVYSCVRRGLCRPARRGRQYEFSFQDLVLLRTALGLMRSGVSARRVRRALRDLAVRLPEDRHLSGVRVYAEGHRLLVREGRVTWHAESGQTLFAFDANELMRRGGDVIRVPRRKGRKRRPASAAQSADDWFERALALQEDDPGGMEAAYRRVLELDPDRTDAYVNLGRLVYERGERSEAMCLYRAALSRDAGDPLAHYGLALALEDEGDVLAAIRHYEEAVRLERHFADAHLHVGRLLERLGRSKEASRHLRAHEKLTRE